MNANTNATQKTRADACDSALQHSAETFRPRFFMLSPTMACQAHCSYCFAPKSAQVMDAQTLRNSIDFIARVAPAEDKVHVVFHGGEPLLAGAEFLESAFQQLRQRFGTRLRLSLQSNLWALTGEDGEAIADVLRDYQVKVGTSIDGPQELCDAQRGQGYFRRTSAGMDVLRSRGMEPGRICTFGAGNSDKAAWVFREADVCYSIHGAVPSFANSSACNGATCENEAAHLSPEELARVYADSYVAYRSNPAHVRITSIDAMARACYNEESGLCLFSDCLGRFAAVGPDGDVYSCQRLGGQRDYCLGNVNDGVGEAEILASPAFHRLKAMRQKRDAACAGCEHADYCKGGCLYNACVAGTDKDPYCSAYQAIFDRMTQDMALEMAGSLRTKLRGERSAELAPDGAYATPLLAMAGQCRHPYDERMNARRFSQAVEAGKMQVADAEPAAELAANPPHASAAFTPESFHRYCMNRLKTLYLNLSYRCYLHCSHCSANAGEGRANELTAKQWASIVQDACDAGFKRIEFSGGDPFAFQYFDQLMGQLNNMDHKGTQWVLRTSLGFPVDISRLVGAAHIFDRVVVSIDGDEEFHDARRGRGTYRRAVHQMKIMLAAPKRRCDVQICAVLSPEQRKGKEGAAVRELANELGLDKPRFHDLLPLGRACGTQALPLDTPRIIPPSFQPRRNCGIGESLSVEPDGRAFACYAQRDTDCAVGDLSCESLGRLLARGDLFSWCLHGVDTNERCRACDVRYLCGGMCLAWREEKANIDSGAFACTKYEYYRALADLL